MKKRRVPELGERDVLIEDIGPIERLEFTAPPGRITVLRGCNGVGKTQALGAVDALVSGRGRLVGRDGTTSGVARGFGVKIAVGRGGANRRSGELEVESIEDRLNIADLVDPGLKDPVAADGRRIRALVALSGVNPDVALFEALVEGGREELLTLLPEEALQAGDLVDMAARVKRALESAARAKETEAANLRRDAEAKRATCEGVDLTAPSDRLTLQASVEDCSQTWAKLREKRAAGLEAKDAREADLRRLDELKAARAGQPSLADLASQAEAAGATFCAASRRVEELRKELAQAEADEALADEVAMSAGRALESAKRETAALSALETAVAGALPECPSSEAVAAAHSRLLHARAAVEAGVRVRDALGRIEQAEEIEATADQAGARAEALRDAARGTEDVLSRIVAGMGGAFRVDKEFRLVVPGTERGEEYFAELSHGERWKLALSVAIEAFRAAGKPGLLSIPQEAWEGLDGDNRRAIADAIDGTDLSVVTAEADHGADPRREIEAEVFEAAGASA